MAARRKRLKKSSGLTRIEGIRRATQPGFVEFCDPTLRDSAPSGAEWVYELKSDGYRAQAHIKSGSVTIFSRRGYDWTRQFRAVAAALKHLKHDAIIDGEAVVIGAKGIADYQALRRELGNQGASRLAYHAFDLLYLDGYDLRGAPYVERKRLLKSILDGMPATISYVDYLEADGDIVFEHACKLGAEGIVAKRKDAPYRPGRQDVWFKLKCTKSDDFPIVAFVEKLGAQPRRIASLYLGRWEGKQLLYAGKARSGYTLKTAQEVREVLDPLIAKRCPLSVPVKKPKATWVRPDVRAEIAYGGVTDDGLLREAVFKGLRDDLALPNVPSPPLADTRLRSGKPHVGVPRENILQLLPDAVAPTKEALADYWSRVHKKALVHLGRRPLKLVRHVHDTSFYHKGPLPPVPPSVHKLTVQKREGGEGTRLWVDDLEGLLGLVAIGAVELHPWNATVDDIEHADQLVIDLDPGKGVPWEWVVETALATRDLLHQHGLESWPKVTGGKGLHIMAPLDEPMTHDQAHRYAKRLVGEIAARNPERYLVSAQAKRDRRIFLDYLRNGRGTTAVGTWSPRMRDGFPIAAPVTWTQVERGIRPDGFSMKHPNRSSHSAQEAA
jgi:bifunctional non-homologous end joining protein LigD